MHYGLVRAGLFAASLTACEHPAPTPEAKPSPVPVAASAPAPPPPAPERTTRTLRCDEAIDWIAAPPESYVSVLDVVAVPKGTLQAYPQHERRFAKSGLVVRRNAKFELEVPLGSSLRIGWGTGDPVERIVAPGCAGEREWMAFAGGFWVTEPGCENVIVRSGDREVRVRIGVGQSCE